MLNLCVILENSARKFPDKDAFILNDTALTYQQINGAANQVANGLVAAGIKPGDKVALSCPNLPYFPIVFFGILKAGATIVPLSVLLKRDEIAYHLSDSQTKAYFCFEGTPTLPMGDEGLAGFEATPSCKDLFLITADPKSPSPFAGTKTLGQFMHGQSPANHSYPTEPNDTALIVYTSGTTGRPKGAELTHSNLMMNTILCADLLNATHQDRILIVLPLFHIFGMTVLMNAGIYRGTTNVLSPRFDAAQALSLLHKHSITIFAGVPTMYWGLLQVTDSPIQPEDIQKNLRICMSGGSSLPVEVLRQFESRYNVPIMEGYGMSEGSPVVSFNHLDAERKPGSVGTPVWGVEIMIADANDNPLPPGEKGQLLYRGHNVMKGYFNRPEVNKEVLKGGWLHSGDVAYMDEDGYYYIVDRTKDMVIRGGLNVYPREVEEVMMEHPAISMVAVIGVPHEQYGEEIKACVVLENGHSATQEEIMDWTKSRIAAYKYPRIVAFMEELPMNATGKILKKELRKG